MQDYIFYDEDALKLTDRSEMKCPEQPMPNALEPSDHIPVLATFQMPGPTRGDGARMPC
ncbi:unnamed protein product [Effrenium voratum]|nr:unnamed protein product [Effrenium voratum]